MIAIREIESVLYGREVAEERTTLDGLRRLVQLGLPKETLRNTASRAVDEAGQQDVIYRLAPRGTQSRRTILTPEESERVERLARVVATAEHVLGDRTSARRFVSTPHPLLSDSAPLDLSYSELGARQVEELLWRIYYGVTE